MTLKLLTFEEFKNIIGIPQQHISFDEFFSKTSLHGLYAKFEDLDERKVTFPTIESYCKFYYEYMFVNSDKLWGALFEKRIQYSPVDELINLQIPIGGEYTTRHQHKRFIKNIFFSEMFCQSETFHSVNILEFIKAQYIDCKIHTTFTMPSIFKDIKNGDVSDQLISMLRKQTLAMSVFSPSDYASMIEYQNNKYIRRDDCSILCPTASWGSPVIAFAGLDSYSRMDVVDVQEQVINKLESIFNHQSKTQPNLFCVEKKLNSYCVPSEFMNTLIHHKFDHIFFCPPYYDQELYGGDNQSTTEYQTYEAWLNGYWRNTCSASDNLLKPNGIFSFVIGESVRHHCVGVDMLEIAKEYFDLLETQYIKNSSGKTTLKTIVQTTGDGSNTEFIHIMKKKNND